MCKISAIDWRDTNITVATNIKDKMAGTLAIGTAIVVDGTHATFIYPIKSLLKGDDAKFGGYRRHQDLVIKVGLYKVPSEIAFENLNNKNSSKSVFRVFLNSAYSNIFIALCVAMMCILAIYLVKETLILWIVVVCIFFICFIKDFLSANL